MNARARQVTPEHSEELLDSTLTAPFRMSKPQLLIAWSVVGVMLVVVFLFGFYSGRRQGVELALTEQSVPRLRLPVEAPKARAALSSTPIVSDSNPASVTTKFDFTDTKPDSFAVNGDESATETIILEPKSESKAEPAAGFVAKAANEVIPAVEQKNEVITAPDQSLAERVAKVELSPTLGNSVAVEKATKIEKVEPKIEVATVKETKSPVVSQKPSSAESKLATTAPAKKAITPPSKTSSASVSGLYVQVGAPDSFTKAQSMVSRLKARGITAAIRDASVNNKLHYRVLVGPFSSRDSAQSAKNQVIKSGVAMGEPFVKNF
jgi:cell division protein FtsN